MLGMSLGGLGFRVEGLGLYRLRLWALGLRAGGLYPGSGGVGLGVLI